MRYLLSLIVAATLISSVFSQTAPAPSVTVIRAGVLIDGKSDQPRRDQVIVVRGHRNDRLGIAIDLPPFRTGSEGGDQRSVRGKDHSANSPFFQSLAPVALQVIAGTEFVHESVAIDVGPAVHENTILRRQPPDEIPAPVVVVHHRAGRTILLEESGRGSGEMMRFRFSLAAHYLS